jgi:hypothetical protein
MEMGTGFDHLALADTGIPGGADVDKLASSLKNIAAGVRNKAKAKKAQAVADAGNYWTLSEFQKGLIPIPQYIVDQVAGHGISEKAVLSLREQGTGATNASVLAKLVDITNGMSPDDTNLGTGVFKSSGAATVDASAAKTLDSGDNTKKYLMYGGIALVLGLIIYFIVKRK